MSDTIELMRPANPHTYTQLVGLSFGTMEAVAMPSAPVWPHTKNFAGTWTHGGPSSSGFGQDLWPAATSHTSQFEGQLAAFYAEFIDGQEPLGPDFEAIWDANVRTLYEA
jgi:hypothetical protein